MSLGMLIIVLLQDQYSYDNFLDRNEDIYRIQVVDNNSNFSINKYASNTFPLSHELKNNYPFIEKICAVNSSFSGIARHEENIIDINGLYAEENFFDMFSFTLVRGSKDKVLSAPYSIVLKEEVAQKFFGDEDPIGKTIEIDDYGILTVTGIVESNRLKSHIQFESIVSASTISSRSRENNQISDLTNNWDRYYSSYIYMIPQQGTDLKVIQTALDEISTERYSHNEKIDLSFYLFPLNKIVPGPIIGNELGVSMPRIYLIFFGGLALVVVISAAFNYTSLAIARSLTRSKEFGIRKTLGASKREVTLQLLIEAILLSIFSMILGIGLLQILLPVFKGFNMMALMEVDPNQNLAIYLWFIGFAVFTGLIAGALPAAYVSRITPIAVLKGGSNIKIFKKLGFRKILLGTQYFFSIVFIITIILIYRQMNFMVDADMGFDRDEVFNIEMRGQERDILFDKYSRIPEVKSITFSNPIPGIGSFKENEVKLNESDEPIDSHYFSVDVNYVETLGLKLIAGEGFPFGLSKDTESQVIITQLAVERYKLGSAVDAIGKNLIIDDTINARIIGVLEDYNYCALMFTMKPLLLRYKPDNIRNCFLRINTNDLPGTTKKFKSVWKEIDPAHEMSGSLLDSEIRDFYSYFEDILYMVGYTTFLALVIACMGLYGMASYSIQTRTKEVGIRKIYGAETGNIIKTISRSSLKLLIIASLIGAPVAFMLNNLWLSYIAEHVDFGAGTVLLGVLSVFVIGLLTISTQTFKVSRTNPAETLKYE